MVEGEVYDRNGSVKDYIMGENLHKEGIEKILQGEIGEDLL